MNQGSSAFVRHLWWRDFGEIFEARTFVSAATGCSMHRHELRYKIGKKGAVLSIFVNIALFIFKYIAGILGNSSAVIADALHTATDFLTSLVVYVGFRVAQKPADKEHPYGHGRAESIAAKIVSLILIILGVKVLFNSIHVITEHELHKPGMIALTACLVSIIVKGWLFFYVRILGKKIHSSSLIADADHHKSDALSSVIAIFGVGLARFGWEIMDPLAGIILAGMVVKMGINNFHVAYDELMDAAPDEELKKKLKFHIMKTEGVMGIKDIRARKMGIDFKVDLTIDVDKDITVEKAHDITKQVKANLTKAVPSVTGILIHVEPYSANKKS